MFRTKFWYITHSQTDWLTSSFKPADKIIAGSQPLLTELASKSEIQKFLLFFCFQVLIEQVNEGIGLDSITREPTVLWHQRRRIVGISVQVKDVGKYKMQLIGGRTLEFSTWNSGLLFMFK